MRSSIIQLLAFGLTVNALPNDLKLLRRQDIDFALVDETADPVTGPSDARGYNQASAIAAVISDVDNDPLPQLEDGSGSLLRRDIVVKTADGYTLNTFLDGAAVNAPNNCYKANTYMGVKLFADGPFDTTLCAAACTAQTNYNLRHPPSTGKATTCQFYNTYEMYKNGAYQGQYCTLYTQAWSTTYATNKGQWRGTDHYTIGQSYIASNATDAGVVSCPSDAMSSSSSVSATSSSSASSTISTSSSSSVSYTSSSVSSTSNIVSSTSSSVSSTSSSESSTSSSESSKSSIVSSSSTSSSITSSSTSSDTSSSTSSDTSSSTSSVTSSSTSSTATCTATPKVDVQQQARDQAALDFLFAHNNLTLMLSSVPMYVLTSATITGDLLPPIQTALQNWVPCTSYDISTQLYACKGAIDPRTFAACIIFRTDPLALARYPSYYVTPVSALTKTVNDYKTITVGRDGVAISPDMSLMEIIDRSTLGGRANSRSFRQLQYYFGESNTLL